MTRRELLEALWEHNPRWELTRRSTIQLHAIYTKEVLPHVIKRSIQLDEQRIQERVDKMGCITPVSDNPNVPW